MGGAAGLPDTPIRRRGAQAPPKQTGPSSARLVTLLIHDDTFLL